MNPLPDQCASRGYCCARQRGSLTAPTPEDAVMPAPLDDRLRDDTVLDEIELTSRLMIAASGHDRHLSQSEVDEILGVAATN